MISQDGNFFVPAAEELLFVFEHAFTYSEIESTRNIKATVLDHNGYKFAEFARGGARTPHFLSHLCRTILSWRPAAALYLTRVPFLSPLVF